MPYGINIFNMKINGVSKNANVDIGPTIQNSHTANSKAVGPCLAFGDFSPANSLSYNNYFDPDVADQGQTANPSAPASGQF
ncbi:hypothetical protein JOD45_001291 [Scopulibacillus daqui]|uniref:Spore germination protein GerPA/GerPF n=1 Tax=Scopulibacillus daqui TaxID=1469162 RepID=A0ABS2PYI3_9BACL|nr:spore germination protein [Scopulibacillus daqui]MBM7645080.1 hypothetical protein [Scopulibacillus daqui]